MIINIFQQHQQQFQLFNLQGNHLEKIKKLMKQYQNLPMDLANASLVILAEYLGHRRIFSVHRRDFNTYRWKNSKPFENLFEYSRMGYDGILGS